MNMLLFATAVVTGGMLLWPLIQRLMGGGAPQVGSAEAVLLMNRKDALVIDGRDKAAFDDSHILNSRNIPAGELDARVKEIEKFKSRPVIISCASDSRAAAMLTALKKHGFNEVFVLREGLRGWLAANLPVVNRDAAAEKK